MPDNQENPMSNNQETSNNRENPPEWLDETHLDPHTSGEADEAVQQLFEQKSNDFEQGVAAYVDSLIEPGTPGGDSEEHGQEYDQVAEDMDRLTDIENRVLQGQ
jgi:hypothetical protein